MEFLPLQRIQQFMGFLSLADLPAGSRWTQALRPCRRFWDPGQLKCLTLLLTNQTGGLTGICFTVEVYDTNSSLLCSTTNCLTFFSCAVDKTVAPGLAWSFDPPAILDAGSGFNIVDLGTVTNGGVCSTQFVTRTWQVTIVPTTTPPAARR